ncbi:hypothetical protein SELMODRAFT_425739 [Selaginella moellendorffii]|uniref:Uncharacterized protein n=1 Tax=Selaginella moellendorffii TaxID=88036 RepID=D8SU43_SELML|nr:hypothetical protein SELMODRAFT_425739 [Selaginella moellendorffii]
MYTDLEDVVTCTVSQGPQHLDEAPRIQLHHQQEDLIASYTSDSSPPICTAGLYLRQNKLRGREAQRIRFIPCSAWLFLDKLVTKFWFEQQLALEYADGKERIEPVLHGLASGDPGGAGSAAARRSCFSRGSWTGTSF